MLGKLLKYDLRATLRFLLIFYVLAILFAGLTRICFEHADIFIVQVFAHIFNGATIAMIANIIINNLMRIWVYFKKNFYGDEGYLTNTLPVGRETLLKSKYLMGLISMVVSFVVIIGTLTLAYLTEENIEALKGFLLPLENATNVKTFFIVGFMIFLIMVEFMAIMFAGFMGIILGHKRLTNRTRWSVGLGFVCYYGMQQVVGIFVVILAIFNSEVRDALLSSNSLPEFSVLKLILAVATVVYVFDIIASYFLARRWFERVDLD